MKARMTGRQRKGHDHGLQEVKNEGHDRGLDHAQNQDIVDIPVTEEGAEDLDRAVVVVVLEDGIEDQNLEISTGKIKVVDQTPVLHQGKSQLRRIKRKYKLLASLFHTRVLLQEGFLSRFLTHR